jgi:aldose 1-epimerase
MKITPFGTAPGGEPVFRIQLDNGVISCEIITFGATIRSLTVPDRNGNPIDVVLGYDTLKEYVRNGGYLGATVGRYANRIAKGRFEIDGKEYRLAINNGPNALHGGPTGFANQLWEGRVEENRVVFSLDSADGHEGYPGALYVEAVYDWDDEDRLELTLLAQTDSATILNLTNHAYFNLAGEGSGSVLDHTLKLNASYYLPTDQSLVPTGELAPVEGTPMDFRTAKVIGRDIKEEFEALIFGKGYDNCWPIDGWEKGKVQEAAVLHSEVSGRTLRVLTDQPAAQVYTGNWLDGCPTGRCGRSYNDYDGVAIECQGYPDAPNKENFPVQLLRKGERYERHIIFEFSAE